LSISVKVACRTIKCCMNKEKKKKKTYPTMGDLDVRWINTKVRLKLDG